MNSYSSDVNNALLIEVKNEPEDCLQIIKVEPEEFEYSECKFPVDLSIVRDESDFHQVSCSSVNAQDNDGSALKLLHCNDTTNEEANFVITNIRTDRDAFDVDPLCTLNYQDDYLSDYKCDGLFVCPLCKKEFSVDSLLIVHMLTHPGFRPFTCKACGKKFTFRSAVGLHKCPSKIIEMFVCNECNKPFNQKSSLILHTKIHSKKQTVCEICNKSLSSKSFSRHKLIHSDRKPHKCNVCNKIFYNVGKFKEHKRNHLSFRPFICDVCQKSFTSKNGLNMHMNVHRGERLYDCNLCTKSFTSKSNLKKHKNSHVRKVHKNK